LYLDRHFRRQCFVPDARKAFAEILLRDRPDYCSCEATGFQRLVAFDVNDAVTQAGFLAKIRPFEPPDCHSFQKDDIAVRLGDILSDGRLHLHDCPENRMLRQELVAFPHGQHDDSADALRQAVHLINSVLFS
jgi:hypothetical protein